ncbi:MAG: hypothetical protein GX587_16990, partial [Bacteroidales bacterium]|nr:hypothetical protein [Bacteroidales bacterium]
LKADYKFDSFEEVNPYFKKLINICKQMNYSEFESESFRSYEKELVSLIDERKA